MARARDLSKRRWYKLTCRGVSFANRNFGWKFRQWKSCHDSRPVLCCSNGLHLVSAKHLKYWYRRFAGANSFWMKPDLIRVYEAEIHPSVWKGRFSFYNNDWDYDDSYLGGKLAVRKARVVKRRKDLEKMLYKQWLEG